MIAFTLVSAVLTLIGAFIFCLTKGVGKKYSRRIALFVIAFFELLIGLYCANLYLDDTEIKKIILLL